MKKKIYKVSAVSAVLAVIALFSWEYYLNTRLLNRENFRDFMEEEEEEKESARPGYPGKLLQWYYEQRAFPTGQIPGEWRAEALEHIKSENAMLAKTASSLSWTQLGPRNIGGRVRSIVIDPTNSNVVYVGSVSGGIWKTTNGGGHWIPLKDNMENLSISSLVIDPNDHNTIYAGTGEGFYNVDAIRGEGIFKSTDAGASWKRLTSTTGSNYYYINRLAIDKTTGTLWAATRVGLLRSNDGGNTFSAVPSASLSNCTDVKIAYTSPKPTIYASFGLFSDFSIYRSTDGGASFQLNYTYGYGSMGRAELAVSRSNPNVAYLSAMDNATYKAGIMRVTTNGGNSWDSLSVAGGEDTYTSAQAWYNNVLAVDPDNENIIFAAGLDLYRSKDKGKTWMQMTSWIPNNGYPYIHADNHSIAFDPNNSNIVYIGNDGGIFKSTNRGLTWTNMNNDLYITQFYYGAVDPKLNVYYGGAQDNGTLKSTDGGSDWTEILGGDGGTVEVDFTNPKTVYMEYVELAFFKSTDGGTNYRKMMSGIPTKSGVWEGTSDRVEFIAPFVMDPNNSSSLIAGTYRVYKTTNGANSWSAISGDLTGDGTGSSGAKISALTIAPGNSDVIYAACSNGRVQVTTDNGVKWALRNSGLPNAYAKRIAISKKDPATAFVVYSGFLPGGKVYKTTDYGESWKNISGNLPNIPVNCILVNSSNSDNVVVGTDLGIFATADGGSSWIQENEGLANVSISDLDYRSSDNRIFAATHGRGMFSAVWNSVSAQDDKPSAVPTVFDISQNYPNPFNPTTSIKYQIPTPQNVSITIFDAAGRRVRQLVNEYKAQGSYQVTWDGRNDSGTPLSSGVYLYTIQAGDYNKTMKMILLK
ncbi:MAG: FlgD immunoglobulin-like domain containing protein [Bacillota bacterium]